MKPALLGQLACFVLSLLPFCVHAEVIHVAVASNFREPAREIAARYEQLSGQQLVLSFGSTGKHYAQIRHGAPFDVFFAADVWRPRLLEEEGVAIADSRFTYARGRLVLWSPQKGFIDNQGKVLETGHFIRLAIANPKLAPYGRAAQEVLQVKGLWNAIQPLIVRGENIGQTYQFVKSGNAELGFVAYSQIKRSNQAITGSYWLVPQTLYQPIEQQVIMLRDNSAIRAFIAYVQSPQVQTIIRNYGYDTQ
ncbi:MAG: molybdate ABC transporter substrate-binding protein [Gammaproteobacteria bacterium]|jgi:molybdate transport system substrate-binding protein